MPLGSQLDLFGGEESRLQANSAAVTVPEAPDRQELQPASESRSLNQAIDPGQDDDEVVHRDQIALFDLPPVWSDSWVGMPEFDQKDLEPWQSLIVHFSTVADRKAFALTIGQTVTDITKSLWYPKAEQASITDKRFVTDAPVLPRYPVYIISKGRWEQRQTATALEKMGVPYHIVVEPHEYANYAAVIDPTKIIALPFSNLGQGSIPARNFVWDHAAATGCARHWILDDNIRAFYRLYNNWKCPVRTGATFAAAEDFTERYDNVALSGFQYFMFAPRKTVIPPYILNTRIYSCILIRNDIPYRWRGRYNEDTDLSIRALKDGWCTILFNAFLADKVTTMTMGGGNTDELYKDDGRRKMAESLREQHPDIVDITWKFDRWQHQVDYSSFKGNRLMPTSDFTPGGEVNNYGMRLEYVPSGFRDD